MTNVVRHSRARRCTISLGANDAGCELVIADDGCGGSIDEGRGIAGMRERIEAAGGTLQYDGSSGLRLLIRIPSESRSASGAA